MKKGFWGFASIGLHADGDAVSGGAGGGAECG